MGGNPSFWWLMIKAWHHPFHPSFFHISPHQVHRHCWPDIQWTQRMTHFPPPGWFSATLICLQECGNFHCSHSGFPTSHILAMTQNWARPGHTSGKGPLWFPPALKEKPAPVLAMVSQAEVSCTSRVDSLTLHLTCSLTLGLSPLPGVNARHLHIF